MLDHDVLLLFSVSLSEPRELQFCSPCRTCSCVFPFSPSLLHAAWDWFSCGQHQWAAPQVTPGTPLCLLTTGDHQSPGLGRGTGVKTAHAQWSLQARYPERELAARPPHPCIHPPSHPPAPPHPSVPTSIHPSIHLSNSSIHPFY